MIPDRKLWLRVNLNYGNIYSEIELYYLYTLHKVPFTSRWEDDIADHMLKIVLTAEKSTFFYHFFFFFKPVTMGITWA